MSVLSLKGMDASSLCDEQVSSSVTWEPLYCDPLYRCSPPVFLLLSVLFEPGQFSLFAYVKIAWFGLGRFALLLYVEWARLGGPRGLRALLVIGSDSTLVPCPRRACIAFKSVA